MGAFYPDGHHLHVWDPTLVDVHAHYNNGTPVALSIRKAMTPYTAYEMSKGAP
jgi:hypothetical protein